MAWEMVIGLEVHAQLATQSKIFSGAATEYGAAPNTQACLVDLGYPGTLPVLNDAAITHAIRFGLAIDAPIDQASVFARKNYFYPDLPKGYQISQFDRPIVGRGSLDIEVNNTYKTIGITRAHLEEDAGKSVHDKFNDFSGIDLNRAGTPLLEIVSEPDMQSADEAIAYLKKLHKLVTFLGISDGNMQEGSFRCDVNLSLRLQGATTLGTRTELKNLNSFNFIAQAIAAEAERQADILDSGGSIIQETRLYDPDSGETRSMRGKEDAHDYRYFPDPDLPVVTISDERIANVRSSMPELPWVKEARFVTEYALPIELVHRLTKTPARANYFETVLSSEKQVSAKTAAHWVLDQVAPLCEQHQTNIATSAVTAPRLAELLMLIQDDTVSVSNAKTVLQHLWQADKPAIEYVESLGFKQLSDNSALQSTIDAIIAEFPEQSADFRAGKEKLMAFFVGQVMKKTRGQANPKEATKLIKASLSATAETD